MTDEQRQTSRGPSRLWPFRARDEIIAIVDMGTQKLACAIVSLSSPRFGFDVGAKNIRVLGSGVVRSSGFSGGRIANAVATETSIRRAVAQAEAEAGMTVEDVLVTGQFPGLSAETFAAKLGAQGTLLKEDIDAISIAAGDHCARAQRKLLHLFMTGADHDDAETAMAASAAADETDVIAISMPLRGRAPNCGLPRQKPAYGPWIHRRPYCLCARGNQRAGAVGRDPRDRHGRSIHGLRSFFARRPCLRRLHRFRAASNSPKRSRGRSTFANLKPNA